MGIDIRDIKVKSTVTFKTIKARSAVTHLALGDLNEIGVDLNGKATGKTMLESARADCEKDLRNGFTVEHTGILGPKGSTEFVDWNADWIKDEKGNYIYAEWGRDSKGWLNDTVRGTLERRLCHDGEVTIVSSKKTFRLPW
mgnify:CR=1 FL=1|tara:strand:+ start:351 stop:773 length:423 start_codon:yes stop_codon:yes gene_type:complete